MYYQHKSEVKFLFVNNDFGRSIGFVSLIIFFSLVAFFSSIKVYSQRNSVDTFSYNKRGDRFYFNGEKIHSYEMKPMLLKYPSSASAFHGYQARATPATLILLTGLVVDAIALFKNEKIDIDKPNTIIVLTSLTIGIPLSQWSKFYLRKSAKLYNQEVLNQLR